MLNNPDSKISALGYFDVTLSYKFVHPSFAYPRLKNAAVSPEIPLFFKYFTASDPSEDLSALL